MKALEPITAQELDEKFDNGEDISAYVDWSKARRPNLEARRVNVDFPAWVVEGLDREARHLGVTRQSVIKMWIAHPTTLCEDFSIAFGPAHRLFRDNASVFPI